MNERNFGIDFLKILCMIMIVVLHVLGQGRVLDNTEFLSVNYAVAWMIEIGALCAVNCYALVSGYVGVSSKHKYAGIIMLWLQVLLYNVVITILMTTLRKDIPVGLSTYVKMFFPVITKPYWYFTAYFALFFVMPCYNCMIEHMPRNQLRMILAVIVVLFSVVPTMIESDLFDLVGGYSFVWLSLLYILGGYFRKYHVLEKTSARKWIIVYIAAVIITLGQKCLHEMFVYKLTGEIIRSMSLCTYISPFMLIAAVALLGFFSQKTFKGVISKELPVLSASAFGVYLIHSHPLIYQYILNDRFTWVAGLPAIRMVMNVLLTAICIFFVCLMMDLARAYVVSKLHIKEILLRLEINLMEGRKNFEGTKV